MPTQISFFNKFIEPLTNSVEFKHSNIYLFAKVKKLRFDIKSTRLINKRTLETTIIVGENQKIHVVENLYNLVPILSVVYPTFDEFNDLFSDEDDFWSCEIDWSESANDRIHFIHKTQKGDVFDSWICPEYFNPTNSFELNPDYNNKPEVVYVGQSFRMLERITSHQTLHKAVSELKDDEELKIYFLTFKYGYGGHTDYVKMSGEVFDTWLSEHGKTNEFKSKIDLVERFLIHFLQPKYNTQHIKTNIENDRLVKEILMKNEIDSVTINIGVKGKDFEFWSEKQKNKTDLCTFNFLELEKGYQEGLITNEIDCE